MSVSQQDIYLSFTDSTKCIFIFVSPAVGVELSTKEIRSE